MFTSNVQFIDQPQIRRPHGKTIQILIWTYKNILTNFFIMSRFTSNKTGGFTVCRLPHGKTCEAVVDKRKYNDSELVIFHGKDLNPSKMPKYRFPYHKWIFYEYETPPNTWTQKGKVRQSMILIRSVFNLTATKTLDSDIPIVDRFRVCSVDEENLNQLRKNQTTYVEGKGNRVAWFVSHCDTQSKREVYVKELSRYIPVDIYGRCGRLSCGTKMNRSNCDKTVLDKSYKFYLSFENSLCENYVTEKLWRLIDEPISTIPIVMGAADYNTILPAGTYLNVRDFKSPKALAEHLYKLDKDNETFNDIIRKKNSIVCRHPSGKPEYELAHQCQVCQYLHEHRTGVTQIPDIQAFWNTWRCISPQDFFKGSFAGLYVIQTNIHESIVHLKKLRKLTYKVFYSTCIIRLLLLGIYTQKYRRPLKNQLWFFTK